MNEDPSTLLIGVGNENRGDDAVGLVVLNHLKNEDLPNIQICALSGDGFGLLDLWEGQADVFMVDAVFSSVPVGTIHRMDAAAQSLPASFFRCSTHNFGVPEAVEMARALNQLPSHLVIFGIEGKQFEPGTPLSREVAQAVPRTVSQIKTEIRQNKARYA